MIKFIAYDEENKRRVLKLNLDSEEEVLSYASYNARLNGNSRKEKRDI